MENESNHPITQPTEPKKIPSTSPQESLPSPKSHKFIYATLISLVLLFLGTTAFFGYQYFQTLSNQKASKLEPPPVDSAPTKTVTPESSFNWKTYTVNEQEAQVDSTKQAKELYLSPSLSTTLENEVLGEFSCLDFDSSKSFEVLENSISSMHLKSGLESITNHVFTVPLVDEDGNSLSPIESKYEISFTNICKLSEDNYVVLFLTTKQVKNNLSLIPKIHAAGGWLGDSHMAIIENDQISIHERFPFVADNINLPSEEGNKVILRFRAYYSCGEIVALTNKHIIIECSSNLYSFDLQAQSFDEIAICGSHIENGSYMNGQLTCFDKLGNEYFSAETL